MTFTDRKDTGWVDTPIANQAGDYLCCPLVDTHYTKDSMFWVRTG